MSNPNSDDGAEDRGMGVQFGLQNGLGFSPTPALLFGQSSYTP
jgi:hypothetical protein